MKTIKLCTPKWLGRSLALPALLACAFVLTFTGCDADGLKRPSHRVTLEGGKKVKPGMVGMVAVPGSEPKIESDKDKGMTYAVLTAHDVVPSTMSGWVAAPAALFNKMSGLELRAKEAPKSERLILTKSLKVPHENNGWVAVSGGEPQIESSANKKGLELATVYTDNVIPKEMHGWVAVDRDTLSKLVEKYMMTGSGSKVSKDTK